MDTPNLTRSEVSFEIDDSEKTPFFTAYVYAFQNDDCLTLQAKGLLAMLLSFGKGWKIYMRDISKRSKSGRVTLRKTVKELVIAGYLIQVRVKDEKGRFIGWSYKVYQKPNRKDDSLISVGRTDRKTEVSEAANVKYIQNSNINNLNNITNNTSAVELNKIGVTEDGIREIISALDEKTILFLISYAKIKNLGPGWLRSAARDHTKRPPIPDSEAAIVAAGQPDPKCPVCHGIGQYERLIGCEWEEKTAIKMQCDCVKRK